LRATIHPGLTTTAVTCTGCGTTFELRSSVTDLRVDVCSSCHPAYTGRHERALGGSQVDRFERRWARGRADRAADRN
jgi:large subunit ribosomal protein L31